MTRRISKGICELCQGEFSKGSITRHLETCQRKATKAARAAGRRPGRTMKHFHLVVEGRDLPMYWMHLQVRTGITLADLDEFLRETWLECCGHMSAFEIEGHRYLSGAGISFETEPGKHSLQVRLDRVFHPGLTCLYEYDFGTTTELRLKVLTEESWEATGESIQLLAYNTPPLIPCGVCGQPATFVCPVCVYESEGWFCAACAKTHACGEEVFLPVVNSPRVGMCAYGAGYTG
jgi:Plasmid pRiA4b ORF-3-like protein